MFEKTAKKTDKRFVKFVKGSHNLSETKRATGYLLVTKFREICHILNFSNQKNTKNANKLNFSHNRHRLSVWVTWVRRAPSRSWGPEGPRLLVIDNSSQAGG